MMKLILTLTVSALVAFTPTRLLAVPVSPAGTFGPLPQANFGGTGIPNDAVMQTTTDGVTLGLTATQRYANPAVGNNGAGTYFATPGGDVPSQPGYARWNFDFYASKGNASGDYFIELLYEFDSAFGNDESSLSSLGVFALSGTSQDSWNLGMGFLAGVSPSPGVFNPNATGEYSFVLRLLQQEIVSQFVPQSPTFIEVDRVAMNVVSGPQNVPDTGSTLALLGFVAVGLFGAKRKIERSALKSEV